MCFVALGVALEAYAQDQSEMPRMRVNPKEHHQIIQGFGINFTDPYFRNDQKAMFDRLVDDLGVTMFRVVPYLLYSNWEEYNDNDDPNIMNWEYYNNRYSHPIFEATWNGSADRSR